MFKPNISKKDASKYVCIAGLLLLVYAVISPSKQQPLVINIPQVVAQDAEGLSEESPTIDAPPIVQSPEFKQEREQLDNQISDIVSKLALEQEKITWALANDFRLKASTFISQSEHPCHGESIEYCLMTFLSTRQEQLPGLEGLEAEKAIKESQAILVAIAYVKPSGNRGSYQQYLDSFVPSVQHLDSFAYRPSNDSLALGFENLISQFNLTTELSAEAQAENELKLAVCSKLTAEEQQAIGGCF